MCIEIVRAYSTKFDGSSNQLEDSVSRSQIKGLVSAWLQVDACTHVVDINPTPGSAKSIISHQENMDAAINIHAG